ncbi:uncharacterized protein LOC135823943 [Sycon ciliatum]|uniref:uncharacterized protein LOC135823943 n=1 Tax=Sycon ciliatum TaxID=27933 RepID=UPI0031F65672
MNSPLFCALLLMLLLCLAKGQTAEPPFPDLPASFVTDVEANILNRGYTTQIKFVFDSARDRARMDTSRNGTRYVIVDDIKNGVQYRTSLSSRTCQARNYTLRDRLETLGSDGQPHLISVNDFFRFGKAYHEKYVGAATVRGIVCDQYMGNYTNTTNGGYVSYVMQWYFARQTNWTMPGVDGMTAIPVRLDLIGVSNFTFGRPSGNTTTNANASQGTRLHNFHHLYEFTNLLPNEQAAEQFLTTNFNPPDGILCTGLPTTEDLPTLPNQFSFTSYAIAFTDSPTTFASGYAYDALRGETSVFYDVEIVGNGTNLTGTTFGGRHHLVHNFRQGTQYNITHQGCTMQSLASLANTRGAFDISVLNGHATLNSANKLFQFSAAYNFSYQGHRDVFGYPTQLWSTLRTDVPLDPSLPANQTTLWEYYFSLPSWKMNTFNGLLTSTRIPIEMRGFSLDSKLHRPYVSVISGFSVGPPFGFAFDTTSCFKPTEQSTVMFSLNTPFNDSYAVQGAIRDALSTTLGLQTDRFHTSTFPGADNLLNVVVTIKGLPSVGDPSLLAQLPTLQTAQKKLRKAIKGGTFTVSLPNAAGTVKAKSSSYTSSSESASAQYSPGEMAGLGIGILILGCIIGGLIMFLVQRHRNSSVPYSISKD